jgi:hypothetical protein
VWRCQPILCMISLMEAPCGPRSMAITWAILLPARGVLTGKVLAGRVLPDGVLADGVFSRFLPLCGSLGGGSLVLPLLRRGRVLGHACANGGLPGGLGLAARCRRCRLGGRFHIHHLPQFGNPLPDLAGGPFGILEALERLRGQIWSGRRRAQKHRTRRFHGRYYRLPPIACKIGVI